MKEPSRDSNYPEAGIRRPMDLDSKRDVGIGRHKEGGNTDTLAPAEKDHIRRIPGHKGGWADATPPKQTMNDLTCNEADVDDLLSAGELT